MDKPLDRPLGKQTPLAAIEEVLASLDQAELVALLEGIKAKVDAAMEAGRVVEREGAVSAAEEDLDAYEGMDAMDRANLRRQEAALELEQMAWVSGTGERFPLRLTSSRYANFEWLRRVRRGYDAPEMISENEALASRYLDAGLLIFLCATPAYAARDGATGLLALAEEWMDRHIAPGRQDESWRLASRMLDLIDLFVPVARASGDEVEGEEAQKKTPRPDGNRDTWPSAANR